MTARMETMEYTDERQNVTALFSSVGIETPQQITIKQSSGETYDLEPRPEDNWVYAALLGLKELNRRLEAEGRACRHFITVGTGPGLDAIGAYHIFHPDFIRVTDINERAAQIALKNLRANLQHDSHVVSACSAGNLLEVDLNAWDTPTQTPPVDVIYANLPNLPAKEVDITSSKAATYVDEKLLQGCPENLDRYLLALQYKFLQQAHEVLPQGGSAVIALGARVPYQTIRELFAAARLRLEELFATFKVQTQPEDVITGYANAENERAETFTFYDYDQVLASGLLKTPMSGEQMQQQLQRYALSSQQALVARQDGKRIGHIVSILRGVKE